MIHRFKTKQSGIGFEFDVELEEDKQIYCFIGKNGIGKTQLLENMAKSLIFAHSLFRTETNEFKYSKLYTNKGIYEKVKEFELKLPNDIEVNNIHIKKNYIINKWSYIKFENIKRNQNKDLTCDKPIIFIGAKNRGFTKNIDTDNIKILANREGRFVESFSRTLAYINSDGLEQEEVANWFVSRLIVNPNFVKAEQSKSNEVITVLKLIEKIEPSLKLVVPNLDGGDTLSMIFDDGRLLIDGIPLDKLSTGFVSIIKIFQEIVAGYGGWENSNDLSQIDGIVFIDEIEPHLHISWQTKIITILKEFFPKTTFYISTHSPLVLAGLKDGEAYELEKENGFVKTTKINKIENYFLNDIVSEFFGVDLSKNKVDSPNKEKHKKAKSMLLNLIDTINKED